jgi:hypothetical protein
LAREHAEAQSDKRLTFDPDWDRLFGWSTAGDLEIWTTRADGRLIGYVSVLFLRHLYSQEWRMANVHTPFLAPEWRVGRLGIEMMATLFDALREREVQIVDIGLDVGSPMNALVERMKFQPAEVIWRKFL